jgi:hypothetical protein
VVWLELVLAVVLATAVHELGHALAALALGARHVRFVRRGLVFAVEWDGLARTALPFLAGPAANIVAAALLVVLGAPLFALVQLGCAVVNLVPHGSSDGALLLRMTRDLLRVKPRRESGGG